MPRSLAERVDRSSLSRHSVGKGSLGRFSVGTEVSVSSAATRHWEHSVSSRRRRRRKMITRCHVPGVGHLRSG